MPPVTLVTGAGGFIAGTCIAALLEQGHEVVAVVRDRDSRSIFYEDGLVDRCTEVRAELSSMSRLINQYEPDNVVHLAAQSQVPHASASPQSAFESNIRGTWLLLEACRTAARPPRSILVASSDKAYGPSDRPYTEDMPLNPLSPYDVSKAAADMIARCYAFKYGLPIVVTRCANTYGPGDLHPLRLVPGACRALLQATPILLRSTGNMVREWTHVDDVVSAMLLLVDRIDQTAGEVYNVGSGERATANEVLSMLFELSGRFTNVHRLLENDPSEILNQASDSSRVRALGWEPRWTLSAGLAHTWRWHARSSWSGPRTA
jgi:CDP-glucose 4,6-dehydratase